MPEVKIILLLRDPVKRAYSHYLHHVKLGVETLSFEDAINEEPKRISGEYEKMLENQNYNSYPYQMYSYLTRGIYYHQVKSWKKYFSDDQLFIIKSKDLFDNTKETYFKVLQFLRLPYIDNVEFKKHNISKKSVPMKQKTKDMLIEYFAPYNQKLYDLLNRDFNWNKENIHIQ